MHLYFNFRRRKPRIHFPRDSLERCWETESQDDGYVIKGTLKARSYFWRHTLKVSTFVQSVIGNGYKIPFVSQPPPFSAKNKNSSTDHHPFVDHAIRDLILHGCVEAVPSEPYCCNPLSRHRRGQAPLGAWSSPRESVRTITKVSARRSAHVGRAVRTRRFFR